MNAKELISFYGERKAAFSGLLDGVIKKINTVSNLRLVTALLMAGSLYLAFGDALWGFATLALLAVFVFLMSRHAVLFRERRHLENLVTVNANEIAVLGDKYGHLDDGKDFLDPHHPYSHDLDIFGPGSLFQYLSRCSTQAGRQLFARRLADPLSDKAAVTAVQEAVLELREKTDFRQHFQASGLDVGETASDARELLQWAEQPPVVTPTRLMRASLIVVPALTLAALAATFISPMFKIPLAVLILVQWIVTGVYLKRINALHDGIGRRRSILQKYASILSRLEQESFSSPVLRDLAGRAEDAHKSVSRLASLVNALNARTNAMATFFVNSFLLYDLQCVFRLEEWKVLNAPKLRAWIDAVAEAEVLCSFSAFAFNNNALPFARISDSFAIRGKNVAHPLIPAAIRVGNDFGAGPEESVLIVTGANMAGKSTFLRALGINVVLALNGAPVCADEFSCPVLALRTGMRTADSLQDHQSYFFAELNRLKAIMDELRNGTPMFILLDEILKGTNSNDKQAGSIALVRQMLPHRCLSVIATHDLAMGSLETDYPGRVKNYCFEATIENDQLSFDYKLKPGIAQRMNASFLMKKMGIIP